MSNAVPRLKMADLAAIELMRSDTDYARYCEGVDDHVDIEIMAKFSKDARDCTVVENPWMRRLIAQRAKLYCEEVLSIPVEQHVEKLKDWFRRLGVIGVLVSVRSA